MKCLFDDEASSALVTGGLEVKTRSFHSKARVERPRVGSDDWVDGMVLFYAVAVRRVKFAVIPIRVLMLLTTAGWNEKVPVLCFSLPVVAMLVRILMILAGSQTSMALAILVY